MMKIKGCKVNVSVYFAAFMACLLITDTTGLVPYALLCAAIHEAGHLVVIWMLHVQLKEIDFEVFGANIKIRNSSALGYGGEILISIAGATANFITAFLCWTAIVCRCDPRRIYNVMIFSLILGAFNLIPACPLDGGRALEAFLCMRLGPRKSEKIINVLSAACIIPVGAAGFYLVIKTGFNFTLVIAAAYMAVSLVIGRGIVFSEKKEF